MGKRQLTKRERQFGALLAALPLAELLQLRAHMLVLRRPRVWTYAHPHPRIIGIGEIT